MSYPFFGDLMVLKNLKNKGISSLKTLLYRFPNIYFTFSSFKIFEFKELLRDISILKSDIILDIGCGDGLETIIIGKKCRKIYGIDISNSNISISKNRLSHLRHKIDCEFIFGRLEDLNFESEKFNKIFSICVLEHISNYSDVLKESYRILKKGGLMIFSVDSLSNISNKSIIVKHKKKYRVEQYFTKDRLKKKLSEIGFKNISIYPILKTEYAKKVFIKEINSNSKNKIFKFFFTYLLLNCYENFSQEKEKGLFLVIKCKK